MAGTPEETRPGAAGPAGEPAGAAVGVGAEGAGVGEGPAGGEAVAEGAEADEGWDGAETGAEGAGASGGPGEAGARPAVTELRLSAFKSHRGAAFPLGPVTVLAGGGGSGKSSVLEALLLLSRLAAGERLATAVRESVRGGAAACAPQDSRPDSQGRRGFRIGCTVDGPAGPVRLDLAVQTEPELRVVGERLTGSGETLLTTALRDPARPTVQAAWHTAGAVPVTRAPLPDDRLATAVLPLRVAGTTHGQRLVLAAAEQVLIALRAAFPVEPRPSSMREPVRIGDGMLRPGCDNLSAVLNRTHGECRIRHAALVGATRMACGGPLEGLVVVRRALRSGGPGAGVRSAVGAGAGAGVGAGTGRRGGAVAAGAGMASAGVAGETAAEEGVLAALDRGPLGLTPLDRLGDSELRFLAMALVLLTGPGVLAMDQSGEVPAALRVMTVVADGLDSGLDRVQTAALLSLARRAADHGHVRLLGTAHDADAVRAEGVTLIRLDGRRKKGGGGGMAEGGSGAGG